MEPVEMPYSVEFELKIARLSESSGKSRDEVIADAISNFLSSIGF